MIDLQKENLQTSFPEILSQAALDLKSDQPAYQQILLLLRSMIQTGQLKPGDPLPSENDLCRHFRVSRTTVRQALTKLAENSLIIRQRGRGSFVAAPKLRRTLDHLYSFTDDMIQMGLQPSSRVLFFRKQKADPEVAQALRIPSSTDIFRLTRIRLAGADPILYEDTAIPCYLCPDIETVDFSTNSLYTVLQNQYGLKLARAIETYEATLIDPDIAKWLACPDPAIGLKIRRIACLDDGAPFEYTRSITRSDRCLFTVELNAAKSQVRFSRKISV